MIIPLTINKGNNGKYYFVDFNHHSTSDDTWDVFFGADLGAGMLGIHPTEISVGNFYPTWL